MADSRRAALALSVLGALTATNSARADRDSPLLAKARAELDAVQLESARDTLMTALDTGRCAPGELVEIHLLLGRIAGGLGEASRAADHFRRLLALSPGARLPEGVAPKISQPFEQARADIARTGPLRARAQMVGSSAVLLVAADPLTMVAGARVTFRGADRATHSVERAGQSRIEILLPPGANRVVVAALDDRGNRLVEIPLSIAHPQAIARSDRTAERLAPPPLYARWWLWAGAAVAMAAGGTALALDAAAAESELDRLSQDGSNHDYAREIRPIERRGQRDEIAANVGFGLAGACALVSAVLLARDFMRRPPTPPLHEVRAAARPGGGYIEAVVRF